VGGAREWTRARKADGVAGREKRDESAIEAEAMLYERQASENRFGA
jgi:hypothetical protein